MAGSYDACATTGETVETEPGVTAGPTEQGFNTRFGEYSGPVSPDDYPPDVVTDEMQPNFDTYPDPTTGEDIITIGPGGTPVEWAYDPAVAPYAYEAYTAKTDSGDYDFAPPVGVQWRRVMALPVADCSGDESGQSTLEVDGFACFFMMQRVGGGPEKNIYGQFVDGCLAGGTAGPIPGSGPGPYLIQLYKDPDSGDS
jgi:hypothetical protein